MSRRERYNGGAELLGLRQTLGGSLKADEGV